MTKTIVYSVIVHSCQIKSNERVQKHLLSGDRYLSMGDGSVWYRLLPKKCNCKKMVTKKEADRLVAAGQADLVWRKKNRRVEIDFSSIWVAQARQVPRVDLISKTDIERAYTGDPDSIVTQSAIEYIEEIHALYMENRAKLIVPFRPDPWEGRTLFLSFIDQRTPGSHNPDRSREGYGSAEDDEIEFDRLLSKALSKTKEIDDQD